MHFIGIDTSCYTSSCAVCDEFGNIIYDKRIPLEVPLGSRGLRQSDMVFSHIRNIDSIYPEGIREIMAFGASTSPRNCEGSYMPVFYVSRSIGDSCARTLGAKCYHFSHQEGHICAALIGNDIPDEFIALHVSGGTTEILIVKKENSVIKRIDMIGGTLDISAGQLIDRLGVKMGFGFPAGREVEENACKSDFSFKTYTEGCSISFSGVESQGIKAIESGTDSALICAGILNSVSESIIRATMEAVKKTGVSDVLMFGGVLCNEIIREAVSESIINCRFSKKEYSSDNACGIAIQAKNKFLIGDRQ